MVEEGEDDLEEEVVVVEHHETVSSLEVEVALQLPYYDLAGEEEVEVAFLH